MAGAIVIGAITAGVILILPMPEWEHSYLLGLLTAAFIGVIGWSVYLSAGNHNVHYGTLGEVATADAVLTLRRKLQGWRLINGLYFDGHGDVDHILIGPGGVFAIESKWTNIPWSIADDEVVGPKSSPTFQARLGAHKVSNTLRFGKTPIDLPVVPVVVLWGRGAPIIDGGFAMVDGVLVAEGRRNSIWVRQLDEIPLDRSTVRVVTEILAAALESRDETRIAHQLAR
jgi:hypothetical protein